MAAVQRQLVHKQFNSPMGLYSPENIKATFNRELKAFGSEGIETDNQIARPLNLASSEVLRAVEEEEQMKCESSSVRCERQSRSRQRFYQRPHTPVHQHQLEQIKTQYLSHQHDVTIDRDTVLKINRLATRRNLHKREHSWPPTTMESAANTNTYGHVNSVAKNNKVLGQEQHIRSTSIDNALQFDETVCKRHGIDVIREKFNSPTRIIEPTAQEVRQRRQQQQQQNRLQQLKQIKPKGDNAIDNSDAKHGVTTNKPQQMVNLVKHEKLLKKNIANKSATITDAASSQKLNEKNGIIILPGHSSAISTEMEFEKKSEVKLNENDDCFKTTTVPIEKGFSHPETKAADENIGLVEPKRLFYEQLNSCKKWHSYENLNTATNVKPVVRPLHQQSHKRQAYSLERGREARQHKQLPPQKPRSLPKLQRRSMKLATEIKISYDTDAKQHNIQVKSLNQPKKDILNPTLTSVTSQDDLEHIPLPATPVKSRKVQQHEKQQCKLNSDAKAKSFKKQQFYDDSCIFLRSIDLQDNTLAYIPAAITIVPSPTEEIMQNWMEASNLKAGIKEGNVIESTKGATENACNDLQDKNKVLKRQLKDDCSKTVTAPEIKKHQLNEDQKQQQQTDKQNANETKAEIEMYKKDLSSAHNVVQFTRQADIKNNKRQQEFASLYLTTKIATHEFPQHTTPSREINSNTTSSECNKVTKEDDKTQQQGFYYTDGEYVYGPYDPHSGAPLANTNVRSMQAEQQEKHQQFEIKKDTEAETKMQNKNEIANLTAKYENIQKSINEHLRQIDAYIENAKAALKSTISNSNKPESSAICQHSQTQLRPSHPHLQQQEKEHSITETPLKEILRKITDIMQEVKPLYRNQKTIPEKCMQPISTATQQDEEENMPIVDKVLMDLNMLTKHLSEFDKNSSEEQKPIMEQLDLQFETRPTATTAAHVLINEETTNNETIMETGKNYQKTKCVSPTQPPTPPPLPSSTTLPVSMTLTKPMQQKRTQDVADKQILATNKLMTTQTQSQQHNQQSPQKQGTTRETTISMAGIKNNNNAAASAEDTTKSVVFDCVTEQHGQEQLVEPANDTLEILKHQSKKNLINTHVPEHDEMIKSNFNQHTLSPNITASKTNKEKNMVKMQNCRISTSPNFSTEDACNHDNAPKSTESNESPLKLHIKDFADKKSHQQFQIYDNPPTTQTNNVVNSNKNNNNKLSQKQEHNKNVSFQYVDYNGEKDLKLKEEEGDSNHSSGSELSNTYKSSYELPSPYVTMRQISWEDVLLSAMSPTCTNSSHAQQHHEKESDTTSALTTSVAVNVVKPKNEIEIAQVCTKLPVTWDKTEPTTLTLTRGHVGIQSATKSKSCMQTKKQETKQNEEFKTAEETGIYSSSLNNSHLQTHLVSLKQRSRSVSPTRLHTTGATEAIINAANETHFPTLSKLSFDLNAVTNLKRSSSASPKHTQTTFRTSPATVDDMTIRKYPAPLVEPHVPKRAASPFGLNAVSAYGLEVKSDNVQEKVYYDEHVDKPTSPVRKYPASLIEPHVPTRAASPFGLNAVKSLSRTPSPARIPHPHHCYYAHETTMLKSTSASSDSCIKAVNYVPQVEGHNVGLLVHTNSPTAYCYTNANHTSSIHGEDIVYATKTPHDCATVTLRNITDNKCCAANNIGRGDDNDDETCDELQCINAIGLTKQGTTATATTTRTINNTRPERQQQQTEKQVEKYHLQNQDQFSSGSGQHMVAGTVSLSTSVINRLFDKVSPRPYVSIEGYKRVAWPPASEERIVREFTPQPQTQQQPAPTYNQQLNQPAVAAGAYAVPSNQGPMFNNVQHNINSFVRETNSPDKQNTNQSDYEAFPPQTPETPIILKDKQFSRLSSQESNQANSVSYQQYQQPQNQSMQQHQQYQHQRHYYQEQPLCKPYLFNQLNNQQQQQHCYQTSQPNMSHTEQQYQYQEEHHQHHLSGGWKPIHPPQTKQDYLFTGHKDTIIEAPPISQQQYQNYHQPTTRQQQQYRAQSFDNNQQSQLYQQSPQQQQQYLPQTQTPQASQNLYQQPPKAGSYNQQPSQQPAWVQQHPAHAQLQAQQHYQQPPWVQQSQQPQQYQQQQQPQYQNPLNQYNQASPHHQQQQQYPLQQNQFVAQNNQQQFNSYSQHQQQQHTVSHDQVDQQQQQQHQSNLSQDLRGTSPGIITLRKEAPVTQKPTPIYTSQPAAISFRGGSNMRGDLKWPPPEYKEAAAKENEERRKLALGPVCRPRKVNRDYTSFFAKNALSHHYPSYKVPPGTQHMIN